MNWPVDDDQIIRQVVLVHEGGYTNNPNDLGHATNWGVTQATLSAWRGHPVTDDDVRDMPQSEAIAIYKKRYILEPGFDFIPDVRLRTALVDAAVLFGPQTVIRAFQAILGQKQDGIIGPHTVDGLDAQESRGLINALSVWRIMRHATRIEADHSQAVFAKGWMARATGFIV